MSRGTQERKQKRYLIFAYGTITHWGATFQKLQLTKYFLTPLTNKFVTFPPYNPQHQSHEILSLRLIRRENETRFGLLRVR